jgi:glucose/arabinose dehydrogenase
VVRVHVHGGRAVSSEDFVRGWQLPNGKRWGRPVALAVLPDGSLLISDDFGGRIWRVRYVREAATSPGAANTDRGSRVK